MSRVSNISSPTDFAVEHKREYLRDRRWRRRRDQIRTYAWIAAGCLASLIHFLNS